MSDWSQNIPEDWTSQTLDKSLSHVVDNRGRTCPTAKSGIPLIATNCIKEFALYPVFERLRYVDEKTYKTWFRGHPEPNDILFVNKGTPGQVCLVPNPVPFCIAQDMVSLRPDKKQFDWKFFFAAMRSDFVRSQIDAMNVGTMIPHLKKTDFPRIIIPKPSIKEQNAIGELYFNLNDKIELNLQTNKTLEEMANALYKHWFVDFGPFKDGKFVESELGMIPEGWVASRLTEVAYNYRNVWKNNEANQDRNYIGLEHLDKGSLSVLEHGHSSTVSSNKYFFDKHDILFGKLRPYFKKVGIAPFSGICSTDILVVRPRKPEHFGLLLLTVFSDQFIEYTTKVSGGTRMPRVEWSAIGEFELSYPRSETVLRSFNDIVVGYIESIVNNTIEIRILKQTRDYLLPKLISGEIRVKDAEKMVTSII